MTAKSLVVGLVLAAAAVTAWLANQDPWEDHQRVHLPGVLEEPEPRSCAHLDWEATPLETFWDCVAAMNLLAWEADLAQWMLPQWAADAPDSGPWEIEGKTARIRLGPAEGLHIEHWPLPPDGVLEVVARQFEGLCTIDAGGCGLRVEARVLDREDAAPLWGLRLVPSLPTKLRIPIPPTATTAAAERALAEQDRLNTLRRQLPLGGAPKVASFGWASPSVARAGDLLERPYRVLLCTEHPFRAQAWLTVVWEGLDWRPPLIGQSIDGLALLEH